MSTTQETKNLPSLQNNNFPEFPFFMITSLIFLDIGIFFGAINAFRWGNFYMDTFIGKDEIQQTHWTSTLMGGVTVLMLGQIIFFFSQVNGKRNRFHWLSIPVLVCWLVAVLGSYLTVWDDYDTYIDMVRLMVKISISAFLLLIASFFLDAEFRENVKHHPALLHLISACVWLAVAVFWKFDIFRGSLDRLFLFTYIYGFFSLTLFGSLTFVLPLLTGQKPRSRNSVLTNMVMLNLAGIIIVYDLYRTLEFDAENIFFDIAGPAIWGLAGFMFAMYIFDLIYKSGANTSLIAQIIAVLMFEFFVFDTFMKNVFTQWVEISHVHFMFIGTLLLTIIATGTRVMLLQYNPETQSLEIKDRSPEYSDPRIRMVRNIGIIITILSVSGVLFGFTMTIANFKYYAISGWSGIALFIGILIIEGSMIAQMRINRKRK